MKIIISLLLFVVAQSTLNAQSKIQGSYKSATQVVNI